MSSKRKPHSGSYREDMRRAMSGAILLLICSFSQILVVITNRNGDGSFRICFKSCGEENVRDARAVAKEYSVIVKDVTVGDINPLYHHDVRSSLALPKVQVERISAFLA